MYAGYTIMMWPIHNLLLIIFVKSRRFSSILRDAQFAGSSSVPAHVEMMGLIGMGNNPMVGATVAVAVAVEEASK